LSGFVRTVLLEAVLVPGLVSGLIVLAANLLGRGRALLGAVALTLGFLAAFHLILGLEFAWPRTAADKLAPLAVLGLAAACASERWRWPRPALLLIGTVGAAVAIIASRPLLEGRPATLITLALLVFLSVAVLWTIERARHHTWRRPLLLASIGFGLAGVAVFARTLLLAELALAIATAMAVIGPRPLPRTLAALLPGIAVLAGLATALALFSAAPAAALLLLVLTPLAGPVAKYLRLRLPLPEPVLFALAALLPPAAATGWTRYALGPAAG
jgi:hypothetical protein